MGNPEGEEGTSSLTFLGSGDVAVKADTDIKSVTVNGVRYEPEGGTACFRLFNLSSDTALNVKAAVKTAASAKVDESTMCTVTCQGCSFTYAPKGLKGVKEGQVPSGAVIYVFADSSDAAAGGYVINGGEPQNPGTLSIQVTVTGNTQIVLQ